MADGIDKLRQQIDALDDELLALLSRRAQLAHRIGALKAGAPAYRPERESEILRRVSETFGVKPSDLRARTRTKAVAFPRQVAMYLTRQLTSDSYADIGRGFGGKDHTTVLHAVNKIEGLLQEDPKFQKTLEHIINSLRVP